jgi:hypothetical protein
VEGVMEAAAGVGVPAAAALEVVPVGVAEQIR